MFFDEKLMKNTEIHRYCDGEKMCPRIRYNTYYCNGYLKYLEQFGPHVIIVFDGYENSQNNTKNAEHLRRARKLTSPDYDIDLNTRIPTSQSAFLSNSSNKVKLICLLKEFFKEKYECRTAIGDADVIIVNSALTESKRLGKYAVIVGEDVDLACLLAGLGNKETRQNTYLYKPGRGNEHSKIFLGTSLRKTFTKLVLALHAITGCDTTSAFLHKGEN